MLLRFHGSLEYGFNGCVSKVGIELIKLHRAASRDVITFLPSVGSRMDIGAIFNFNRLILRLDKAPELFF